MKTAAHFPFRNLVVSVSMLTLLVCHSLAQVSNASISGVVRDASGAIVPDANVSLRNLQTNVERKTVTNGSGEYVFPQVLPGTYSIQVSKAGFETSNIPSLTLTVSQKAVVDVTLNIGQVSQSINVQATGEQIEPSSAGLGGTVTERQVVNLPLNGRNFTQLITLSPGVSPISVGQNAGGGEAAVANGSNFVMAAIEGQTNRSTFYLTDGINNTDNFFGTYGVAPIIDTLEEFKVNTHPDDAQFGGALGGTINAVTKSGTNQLHGSLWEFVRNDVFDARNTFLKSVTPYRQNQYGFTVGGPVILPKLYNGRNKTFFFGGMEWFKFRQPSQNFLLVPTPSQLNGNLSDLGVQIYNPCTTTMTSSGTFVRAPYPGNIIPAAGPCGLNTGMITYAKAVLPPIVNTGVPGKNAIDATPVVQDMREYTGRIDQTIGQKNFLWFRYSAVDQTTTQSGGLPSLFNRITRPGTNYGASYVRVFSPSTVMQLQFGRLLAGQNAIVSLNGVNPSQLVNAIGFVDSFVHFANGAIQTPNIGVPGYFSGGMSTSLEPDLGDIYQGKASISKIIGTHTLSFGGEFDSTNYESYYEYSFLNFAGSETANPALSTSVGSPLASFLIGVPDYAAERNVHETFRFGGVFGAYIQDSWKVTPALTLNIGLRYDLTLANPYGTQATVGQPGGIETGDLDLNHGGVYILQKVPPSCADRGHAPCLPNGTLPPGVTVAADGKILQNTYTNWGPRLGIAYRVSPNTAIRTGFGIFYDNWAGYAQRAQSIGGNWPDQALVINTNLNHPTATQLTPNTTIYNPIGPNIPAATPFQRVQRYFDPHIQNPYSMQWNFDIQHQFGPHTLFDIAYVGSGSRRLSLADYTNVAVTPGPGNPVLRQPFPNIHATYYETDAGRSDYESLQVQVAHRYANGLQFNVSYTWSKSMDIGCSGFFGVEGCSVQNPYNTSLDRSVSGFDLTHILSVGILYQLPIGQGKLVSTHNRVLDYILGNWQLNTLTTARSGTPYTIVYNADTGNTGNLAVRPNVVANPNLPNPTPQRWFNTNAFTAPALYTFGTLGRNALRTQPFWNIDLSLFRQFPFMENKMVEFRAEAFNAPNTVIYGQPGSTFGVPGFGVVSSTANTPRELQLGLKVIF